MRVQLWTSESTYKAGKNPGGSLEGKCDYLYREGSESLEKESGRDIWAEEEEVKE